MKIDFVLLLIRKIETLHLRSTEQHVVGTDVGSLHSCTGWGGGGMQKCSQDSLFPELRPPPCSDPRPDDTLGKQEARDLEGEAVRPAAEKPALNFNSSSATGQLCDLEFALNPSVP